VLQSNRIGKQGVVDNNNNKTMKKTTTKKKKRKKKKKQMDQGGNNNQKQNIAKIGSSMITLCFVAMMAMMLMASNAIVVDGSVLSSNVLRLNDETIIEQDVIAAMISSDVCNYVNCNDVMEVDDIDTTTKHVEENDLVTGRYGETRDIMFSEGMNQNNIESGVRMSEDVVSDGSADGHMMCSTRDVMISECMNQDNIESRLPRATDGGIESEDVVSDGSADGHMMCSSFDRVRRTHHCSIDSSSDQSVNISQGDLKLEDLYSKHDLAGTSTPKQLKIMSVANTADQNKQTSGGQVERNQPQHIEKNNVLNSDESIISAELYSLNSDGSMLSAELNACENIKQGGVSYVARHSQHIIEEEISKELDISNRTADMSQQHDETNMGRYDYQGSDNLDVGSTSAGSLDSSVNEYTTAKADGSVSERCDIEIESDIIVESGIGSEGQVDDLVGDKSKVGIFSSTHITKQYESRGMYDSKLEYDGRLHILYDENEHSTTDVIFESDMYITDMDTVKDTGSIDMDTKLECYKYDPGECFKARRSGNAGLGESEGSLVIGYHGIFELGGVLEGKVCRISTIPDMGVKRAFKLGLNPRNIIIHNR